MTEVKDKAMEDEQGIMKIAFLTSEYPPVHVGGAGIYAKYVTEGLAERGHQVYVFAPKGARTCHRNLKMIEVPAWQGPFVKSFSFWRNTARAYKQAQKGVSSFDIVHINGYVDVFLGRPLTQDTVRITTVHHPVIGLLREFKPSFIERLQKIRSEIGIVPLLERLSVERADHIVTVSEFSKSSILKYYGVPEEKVTCIYSGHEWVHPPQRLDRKASDTCKLLFVGRLEERKGLSFLLRSFAKASRLTEYKLTLEIVGAGSPGNYQKLASRLGIEESVKFRGYLPVHELNNMYSTADIFVMPSRMEGFGIVLLEAMDYGLPIICTDRGGMPEVVSQYNRGFIVEFGNEKALATMIGKVADAVCHNRLPEGNVDELRQVFNWSNHVQSLINLYESLLDNKRRKT